VAEARQDKLERTGWSSLVGVAAAAGFPHPHLVLVISGLGQRQFDMMVLLPP